MKAVFSLSLVAVLFTGFMALAAENTVIICKTNTQKPNGLGIKSVKLDISNNRPRATMVLTYLRGSERYTGRMSYSADKGRHHFTPKSEGDGTVSVHLVNYGGWTGTATDAHMDTFSLLYCTERK